MAKKKFTTVIGAGGTGANIVNKLAKDLATLGLQGEGLSNINLVVIDTSITNKEKAIEAGAKFIKVDNTEVGGKTINGGGTIRGENLKEINNTVSQYVNNNEELFTSSENFTIIISSGGGSSGSVISPSLTKKFIEIGATFGVVVIGDDRDAHTTINIKDTLQTFHNIAVTNNTNIALYYVNNTMATKESDNDDEVSKYLISLSIFLSGENESLDPSDMSTFFTLSKFARKLNVPAGVNLVDHYVYDGLESDVSKNEQIIVARILVDSLNHTVNVSAKSVRKGVVKNKNLLEKLNSDVSSLPLILTISEGGLKGILDYCVKRHSELSKEFKSDEIPVGENIDEF